MPNSLQLKLATAVETEILGEALARSLPQPGGSGIVLYLRGELGAGKTTCVRSLLRALGAAGVVRSPTYTLLETYPLEKRVCVHVDLYRIAAASEVDELGLRDLLDPAHLLLIEWPEKGGRAIPEADMDLHFDYAEEGRLVQVAAAGEAGGAWLRQLGEDNRLVPYVSNLT